MRRVTSAPEIRAAAKLEFCYVCGCSFADGAAPTRDHVPPKRIFSEAQAQDRPLILRAHAHCNNSNSGTDKIVGQLFSLTHDEAAPRRKLKSMLRRVNLPHSEPVAAVDGIDLNRAIWRWIRAFHAALYAQFMTDHTSYSILPPLPTLELVGECAVPVAVREQYPDISHILKQCRACDQFDSLRAWGGSLRYECAWVRADGGRFVCLFALDLNNWIKLGDVGGVTKRGCVGHYVSSLGLPAGATVLSRTEEVPVQNLRPLDPFEGT